MPSHSSSVLLAAAGEAEAQHSRAVLGVHRPQFLSHALHTALQQVLTTKKRQAKVQQTSQQAATTLQMQISMQLQSIRPLRPVLLLTCPAGPCAPSCIATHASSTGRVKLMFRPSSDSRASTTACKGAEGRGDTWGEGKQPGGHKRCRHVQSMSRAAFAHLQEYA